MFSHYVDYGTQQLRWINGALAGATPPVEAASEVDDPDMKVAILRLTGPKLQAAMLGTLLLGAWLDFLNLADVVLQQCHFYSEEKLLVDMDRVRKMLEPSMIALASLEPRQVEATAAAMPGLMGQLAREFDSTREGVRVATERGGQVMLAAQIVDMISAVATIRMSLPRQPPAAPAALGVGLVMGADGVMMGRQIVVSAEWVEMMRRLVKAGVISLPVVSTAVRIQAGQLMMSQGNRELPKGVRDALGDGPEVRAMHETGKAGAGMAERPKHHVLPREHRPWFEERGFTGDMSIDEFCVQLESAHHQAVHGGGNWRMGRLWPEEWSQKIMFALRKYEASARRMLTRGEILKIVAIEMKRYGIPLKFTRGSSR